MNNNTDGFTFPKEYMLQKKKKNKDQVGSPTLIVFFFFVIYKEYLQSVFEQHNN